MISRSPQLNLRSATFEPGSPPGGPVLTWQVAMDRALYGPGGFFVTGPGPAGHFRTSAHASPQFGQALLRLIERIDAALGDPDPFDLVDVGAGRGELLRTLATLAPPGLARRLRCTAVELVPRPDGLPDRLRWRNTLPERMTGLLLATEWLDNVPVDVARYGPAGWCRILVEPATGVESVGGPVPAEAAGWLDRWWPPTSGGRAEIGLSRDTAWAEAVARVVRGAALTVDYGHLRADRPPFGTLTSYRAGRQVPPVPDGSRDITAHVAVDSVAAAGSVVAGLPYTLLRQREALCGLGVTGRRPPLALAGADPAAYLRALAAASAAAELTEPTGLGGHWWLLQPVGLPELDLGLSGWEPVGPGVARCSA